MIKKAKHIHWVRIKPHTDAWLKWRYENGIGGSEIASVLASVSKPLADLVYTPPIKWYLAKIGEPVQEFTGNVESESGHFFEPIILNFYKHYDLDDPSQMDMFNRIKRGTKLNKVYSPKVFVTNDKYPGFFYSPDAFTWPMGKSIRLGECKNTTSMTARKFVNKVDPAFYIQVQQGLMINELDEADLCILVDGRWFEVITIKANPEIHKRILEIGSEMWLRVLKARAIKLEYGLPNYFGVNHDFLNEKQREGAEILSSIEPDLIGTEDELEFIKEMIEPSEEEIEMIGTDEQLKSCIEYHTIGNQIGDLNAKLTQIKEELILSLGGFNIARFEDKSYFSYKTDKRGTRRLFVSDKVIKSDAL